MRPNVSGNSKHIRSNRSFVWHHFKKSEEDPDVAICNYCKRGYKVIGGTTTSLIDHLLRYHRKRIKDTQFCRNIIKYKPPKASEAWNKLSNFLVPKNDQDDVVYNNCKVELEDIGNAPNFQDQFSQGLKRKRADSETMPKTRIRSYVWEHFVKSAIADHAICKHCNKQYKTHGNTSNLGNHLKRFHKEVFISSGETVNLKESLVDPLELDKGNIKMRKYKHINSLIENCYRRKFYPNRPSSFVWRHFGKNNVQRMGIAECNYCKKTLKTGGTTSSLRYHLMKFHKEKLGDNEDNKYENPDTDSNDNDNCGVEELEEASSNSAKKRVWNKPRSLVWDHFKKSSDSNTAVCMYCEEECKTSGNTTNLMLHLIRHHSKLIGLDEDEENSTQEIDCSESDNIESPTQYKCFTWNHFEKSTISNMAICNYCSLECNNTRGNTAHLKSHLMNCHPEKIIDDVGQLIATNTKARKPRSVVWNHFEKCDLAKVAICVHCKDPFNTTGNTSNLRDHLKRKHKLLLGESANESIEQLVSSEEQLLTDEISLAVKSLNNDESPRSKAEATPSKRCKSFIWKHFDKTEDVNRASCLHCSKIFNTSGNTTNMRDHLLRKHREQVMGNIDKLGKANLVLTESKRPCKSFVWKHFEKSDIPWTAICNYCNIAFNTCGNTTNMKKHLLRYHAKRVLVEDDEAMGLLETTLSDDSDSANFEEPSDNTLDNNESNPEEREGQEDPEPRGKRNPEKRSKSLIWKHFNRTKAPNKVTCTHCNEPCYTSGNTTNLWTHLISRHKESIVIGDHGMDEDSSPQETLKKRKNKSISQIWKHFEKKKDSRRALCLYCKKEFHYSGTTTNLWTHMRRRHEEYMNISEDEEEEEETAPILPIKDDTEETRRLKSYVWRHFAKSDDPEKVICIHCKEQYKNREDTRNLRSHLLKYHKKELGLPEGGVETQTEIFEDEESAVKDPKRKSTIWNHFRKSESLQKMVCVYCNQEYNTSGHTSNLWKHFDRFHKDIIENGEEFSLTDENVEVSIESETEDNENQRILRSSKQKEDGSIAWGHFETNDKQKGISIHCEKEHKIFRNTDLKAHLTKHHEDSTNNKSSATNSVQKHFKKILTPQFAVCNLCDMWCELGGDATLKTHLSKYHKEEIDDSSSREIRDSTEDASEPTRKHFKKSPIPEFALCTRCDKLCKITDLKSHLATCVNERPKPDRIVRTVEEPKSSKSKSFVWKHLDRLTTTLAKCKYCNMSIKTYGNTTNARKHLVTHHKSIIIDEGLGNLITARSNKARDKEGGRGIYLSDFVDPEDVLSTTSESPRMASSLVWLHFDKCKLPQYVICNYCTRLCKYYGNTTNLRSHLGRFHREVRAGLDEENCEEDIDEKPIIEECELVPMFSESEYSDETERAIKDMTSANGLDGEYVILVVSDE